MGAILTTFGNAFAASAALALPAAFLWGVLSVVLSPCHLSSIPLVVAYMNGGTAFPTGRRALGISTSFAVGILAATVAAGVSAQGARRWLAWKNGERAARLLRGAAGLAVISGGIYFLHTAVQP